MPTFERMASVEAPVGADLRARDAKHVEFERSPAMAPFLDAARKTAAAIERTAGGAATPAGLRDGVDRVRALEVGALLSELPDPADALALLYHLAEALAYANVAVAWQGLSPVPWRLPQGGAPEPLGRVAFPGPGGQGPASTFHLFWPIAACDAESTIGLYDPAVGLRSAAGDGPTRNSWSATGLLGFPAGELRSYALERSGRPTRLALSAAARNGLVTAELTLLSGLVAGATRRLVDDAYAYARVRQSEGRPIAQHQAVALRLADLALHQQALSVYLTGHVEGAEAAGVAGSVAALCPDCVTDLAFRIARDAVQVAAGHGYVEGLPFRRLFEEVRTLTSALSTVMRCVAPAAAGTFA